MRAIHLHLSTADTAATAALLGAIGIPIVGSVRPGERVVAVPSHGPALVFSPGPATRTALSFQVPDLTAAAQRLDDAAIPRTGETPGVIGLADADGNPVYLVESPQCDGVSLIAATLFVRDAAASASWWQALGATVTDTAVFFDDGPSLHLEPAADGPATTLGADLRVSDPTDLDAAAAALAGIGASSARLSPVSLRTATPEGGTVTVQALS